MLNESQTVEDVHALWGLDSDPSIVSPRRLEFGALSSLTVAHT